MTTIAFADLINQAAAEGFSNEILPSTDYDVEVASTKLGTSQGGKPQIGVRFKVLAGPHAGKSVWDNLTLTADNPKAVAVFLRKLGDLGVSSDFIAAQSTMEPVVAAIQVGRQYRITLGTREHNNKTYQEVKKLAALDTPIVAAPTVAAAPAVAVQPTLAPAVAAAAAAPVAPAVTAPPTVAF